MAFTHPNSVDARQSTFNDIGRDQIYQTVQINISLFGPRQPPLHTLRHSSNALVTGPASPPKILGRGNTANLIPVYHSSAVISTIDSAAGLVIQIVQLLIGHARESPDIHCDLRLELTSLCQSLLLTRTAIQEYESRPLAQSLANTICPEVVRCRTVLHELLNKVIGTQQGLNSTRICSLWRPVWWSIWDGDELVSLKIKLSDSRKSLDAVLMALNSVAWVELGDGLQRGDVSLKKFHTLLGEHLPSLHHIQLDNVQVVDHLGRNIPVPALFCSTWKDFDYIINGYCKGRVGDHFIERGQYEVVRAEDNQVISPSVFANIVRSGMVFEMSIVLRQELAFEDNKNTCPRCHHINLDVTKSVAWIECHKCSGKFQVAQAKQNDEQSHENRSGEQLHRQNNNQLRSNDSTELLPERSDENDIVSPSSQPREKTEHQEEDGMQFFHRIHVICSGVFPDRKRPALIEPSTEGEDGGYPFKVEALYAYTPDSTSELSNYPDDLSFAKGEILDVVDIQEEWWQARKADRTVGIVPSNFFRVISSPKRMGDPRGGVNVVRTEPELGPYTHQVRARYDYTASPDDPDELSFIQGETLDIPDTHRDIHDMSGFWWQARKMDGTIGFAQSNFLQIISSPVGNSLGGATDVVRGMELEPDSYRYKALFTYTASPVCSNDLSFTKGEILDVIDKQEMWWKARKADGTIGVVPSNFLLRISSPALGGNPHGGGADVAGTEFEPVSHRYKALYAYTSEPNVPTELSFAKDEILDVVNQHDKWWVARKADGTTGCVPQNFLQMI